MEKEDGRGVQKGGFMMGREKEAGTEKSFTPLDVEGKREIEAPDKGAMSFLRVIGNIGEQAAAQQGEQASEVDPFEVMKIVIELSQQGKVPSKIALRIIGELVNATTKGEKVDISIVISGYEGGKEELKEGVIDFVRRKVGEERDEIESSLQRAEKKIDEEIKKGNNSLQEKKEELEKLKAAKNMLSLIDSLRSLSNVEISGIEGVKMSMLSTLRGQARKFFGEKAQADQRQISEWSLDEIEERVKEGLKPLIASELEPVEGGTSGEITAEKLSNLIDKVGKKLESYRNEWDGERDALVRKARAAVIEGYIRRIIKEEGVEYGVKVLFGEQWETEIAEVVMRELSEGEERGTEEVEAKKEPEEEREEVGGKRNEDEKPRKKVGSDGIERRQEGRERKIREVLESEEAKELVKVLGKGWKEIIEDNVYSLLEHMVLPTVGGGIIKKFLKKVRIEDKSLKNMRVFELKKSLKDLITHIEREKGEGRKSEIIKGIVMSPINGVKVGRNEFIILQEAVMNVFDGKKVGFYDDEGRGYVRDEIVRWAGILGIGEVKGKGDLKEVMEAIPKEDRAIIKKLCKFGLLFQLVSNGVNFDDRYRYDFMKSGEFLFPNMEYMVQRRAMEEAIKGGDIVPNDNAYRIMASNIFGIGPEDATLPSGMSSLFSPEVSGLSSMQKGLFEFAATLAAVSESEGREGVAADVGFATDAVVARAFIKHLLEALKGRDVVVGSEDWQLPSLSEIGREMGFRVNVENEGKENSFYFPGFHMPTVEIFWERLVRGGLEESERGVFRSIKLLYDLIRNLPSVDRENLFKVDRSVWEGIEKLIRTGEKDKGERFRVAIELARSIEGSVKGEGGNIFLRHVLEDEEFRKLVELFSNGNISEVLIDELIQNKEKEIAGLRDVLLKLAGGVFPGEDLDLASLSNEDLKKYLHDVAFAMEGKGVVKDVEDVRGEKQEDIRIKQLLSLLMLNSRGVAIRKMREINAQERKEAYVNEVISSFKANPYLKGLFTGLFENICENDECASNTNSMNTSLAKLFVNTYVDGSRDLERTLIYDVTGKLIKELRVVSKKLKSEREMKEKFSQWLNVYQFLFFLVGMSGVDAARFQGKFITVKDGEKYLLQSTQANIPTLKEKEAEFLDGIVSMIYFKEEKEQGEPFSDDVGNDVKLVRAFSLLDYKINKFKSKLQQGIPSLSKLREVMLSVLENKEKLQFVIGKLKEYLLEDEITPSFLKEEEKIDMSGIIPYSRESFNVFLERLSSEGVAAIFGPHAEGKTVFLRSLGNRLDFLGFLNEMARKEGKTAMEKSFRKVVLVNSDTVLEGLKDADNLDGTLVAIDEADTVVFKDMRSIKNYIEMLKSKRAKVVVVLQSRESAEKFMKDRMPVFYLKRKRGGLVDRFMGKADEIVVKPIAGELPWRNLGATVGDMLEKLAPNLSGSSKRRIVGKFAEIKF